MPSSRPLDLPFTPPTPRESAALKEAAAYLKRAANEVATRRLHRFAAYRDVTPENDLPGILTSAGLLLETVVECASGDSPLVATVRRNVSEVPRSV